MTHDPQRRLFRLDAGAPRVERDVDEELAFHLAMRTQKLIGQGYTPADAAAEARRQFGDVSAVRAECLTIDEHRERQMRRVNRMADLRQDVGYAVRTLRRQKGVVGVVLTILALGIGANTAMFTLIDALLLRALPVPHPEQLMTIGDPRRTGSLSQGAPEADLASYPLYADVRDHTRTLTSVYANGRTGRLDVFVESALGQSGVMRDAEAEHPRGRFVSGNFFAVLEVPAYAGRTFTAQEDRVPGADPVVVLSYDYWQHRFGGARDAIGRTIVVNGTPLTIIGVTPAGFVGDIVGQPQDLWIPLMMQPALRTHSAWLTDRNTNWLLLMGRLAPGVSLAQARSEITQLERRSLLDNAPVPQLAAVQRLLRTRPVRVEAGARGFSHLRSTYARPLYTLMAAVGLVLLVVCANVGNLMLARAAARRREMSVRMALGAGRRRLVQQLLTESLLLAVAGGALGLLVAYWGSLALLRIASAGPARIPLDVHLDARILAFTAGVSLVTAVLFGLVPAVRATRVDLAAALRTQGRGAVGWSGRLPVAKVLVAAQVALSTLLLVATGMLVRSTQRLENADIGVDRDHLLIATIDGARGGYEGPRLLALMDNLLRQVGRLPGVAAVSLSENGLFSGSSSGTQVRNVEGFVARADTDSLVAYDDVGPHYFEAVGAHILRGRDFDERDGATAPQVVILNETAARFYFPRGDALGHHLTPGVNDTLTSGDSTPWEIVGVVRDVQEANVRSEPVRRLYVPTAQLRQPPPVFYLEARATGEPARLVVPLRRALQADDPSLAVLSVDPLTTLIQDSISQDKLVARVVTFFGLLALVLASIGLYGIMAYATVRRTGEIGLRMALGAQPADLTRMVLGETLALMAAGVVLGLPVALAATRLLRGQLFGVGVVDPPSLGLAVVVLAVSAVMAGYLPARRAARVSPMVALRAE